MAQLIQQGDIFGRLGTGVGQGLAEQLPKEIERGRLASGVQGLLSENLTPAQFYARALSVPGLIDRPEVIQNLQNFARQQSFINQAQGGQTQSPVGGGVPESLGTPKVQAKVGSQGGGMGATAHAPTQQAQQAGQAPISITKPEGVQTALTPYVPPSYQEVDQRAKQKMASNPVEFPTYEAAVNRVNQEIGAEKAQYDAKLEQRAREQEVQSRTQAELDSSINPYKGVLPDRMYRNLEQQAFRNVQEGMTEKQAAELARKKAEQLARDVSTIQSWGGSGLITNRSTDLFRAIENLQKKYPDFEDRRDLADLMVAENKISPMFAYSLMMPVKSNKELNSEIKNLPTFQAGVVPTLAKKGEDRSKGVQDITEATLKIAPKIFKAMGTQGSPLAVAYELKKKGYDPDIFLQYASDNSDYLTGYQADQLSKTSPLFFGALNDLWFQKFTGVE